MEKLATDIYTFDNLVRYGFTYIDKTDRLWPLVNLSVGKQFLEDNWHLVLGIGAYLIEIV